MRPICRLFTDTSSSERCSRGDRSRATRLFNRQAFNRQALRRVVLAFALALLCVGSSPRGAQAITNDEAANFAVDAFIEIARTTASWAGLTIPPEAVDLVKEMALCGVKGKPIPDCAKESVVNTALKNAPLEVRQYAACAVSTRNLAECGKQEVLKQLPEQARPLVDCLIGGESVAACAGKVAIGEITARVPAEVRPLVQCVAERGPDSAGACAAEFATDKLEPGPAKDMALCVKQGTPVKTCAETIGKGEIDQATKAATDQVLAQLHKLQADTEDVMKNLKGSVYNIVTLAQGLQQGRIDKILDGGGPEVAKIVITNVINGMVPAAAPITGPVVGALVDLYVDTGRGLAREVVEMLATGDVSKVAKIIFQFYFEEMIARPCAVVPDGGFKDATCGNMSKLITAVADPVGEAAGLLYQISQELLILSPVGTFVSEAILGFLEDLWKAVTGGDDEKKDPSFCGSGEAYFAASHLQCLGAATAAKGGGLSTGLNTACVTHFTQCFKGESPGKICGALGNTFDTQVGRLNAALADGARVLTSTALGAYLSQDRDELCTDGYSYKIDNAIEDFLSTDCTSQLSKMMPLNTKTCKITGYPPITNTPQGVACGRAEAATGPARADMNKVCEAHCRENPERCLPTPPCVNRLTGRVYSPTRGATCWTAELEIPRWKIPHGNWDGVLGKPVPPMVYGDLIDRDSGRGVFLGNEVGNFVIDGGGMRGTMNGGLPSGGFIAGKCAVRGTTSNLVMNYTRPAGPNPGLRLNSDSWLSLNRVSLVSGFNTCSGGPSLANLPSGPGSGGAYLSRGNDNDDVKIRKIPARSPPRDTVALPGGDRPNPMDILGGGTGGASGVYSSGPNRSAPSNTAKPAGANVQLPGGASGAPIKSFRKSGDSSIDYGGVQPGPGPRVR